ncbi:hypothetical protein V8D89_001327 [Ganoderma adspersum]
MRDCTFLYLSVCLCTTTTRTGQPESTRVCSLCRPPTDFPTQTDPSQSSRLVKHRAKGGRARAISSCLDVVTSPDPLVATRSRLTRRTPMTLLRCSC